MALDSIHKKMAETENYKKENKVAREALKNELENNSAFLEACEEFKAASEKRKRIKEEILAKDEVQKIIIDINENKVELETLEEILSTELVEYVQENKTQEIEDAEGEKREIKIVAKLVPKKKQWDDRDFEGKYAAKVEPDLADTSAGAEAAQQK